MLIHLEIESLQHVVRQQKLEHTEVTPEVILVDGNGALHERKAELATLLGLKLACQMLA